jgi:membrane protein required for colicin V production
MAHTALNIFDFCVLGTIGLSALLSFFRGFVREVLSLCTWVGASIITLYFFPTVSHWIAPQVKSPEVASGLAALGLFLTSLIFISIFTGLLLKFVKTGKEVGLLDNMVGLLFGTARGVLLVSIAYFIMTLIIAEKDYPDYVKNAATRPYVAESARYVSRLAPTYLHEAIGGKHDSDAKDIKIDDHALHNLTNSLSSVPSVEELQQRMRDENAGNDVR